MAFLLVAGPFSMGSYLRILIAGWFYYLESSWISLTDSPSPVVFTPLVRRFIIDFDLVFGH